MSCKLLIICVFTVTLSCTETSTDKKESNDIGKYVYIDYAEVLHTKQGCKAVFSQNKMQVVTPVKTEVLNPKRLERICSQCVTEEQLERLEDIVSPHDADVYDPINNDD